MPNLSFSNRQYDRLTAQDERQWISRMRGFFDRQLKPLTQRIEEIEQPEMLIYDVRNLILPNELLELYKGLYTNQGAKYYEQIINTAKGANLDITEKKLDPNDPYFRNMGDFVETVVATRVSTITNTSRKAAEKAIQAAIAESVENGWGVQKTKRAVDKAVKLEWRNMKKFRPHFIARTEVASMANRASYLGAKETGLNPRKEWSAFIDEHTRATHIDADGQSQNMDEPFIVGGALMEYPGAVGAPAQELINCRCRARWIA